MSADPAELQRATEALAEAHRRTESLAVFARRVAHDLSNFLTVIRTYSELVLAEVPPESTLHADITEISQAADTTVAYMQRASAFGRVLQAPASPVAVDELIDGLVAHADSAGTGPVRGECASAARVLVSAAALEEAVQELLRNAREASPTGAPVTVRTRCETLAAPRVDGGVPLPAGTWALVEVIDQGPGLHESVATHAFDPFVTTKTGVRGAGLGLSIARATAWGAKGELLLVRDGAHTIARLCLPLAS